MATDIMSFIKFERINDVFKRMTEANSTGLGRNNVFIIPEADIRTSESRTMWCVSTHFWGIVPQKSIRRYAETHAKEWREKYGFRGDVYIVRKHNDDTRTYDLVTV